jgi:Fic family protein
MAKRNTGTYVVTSALNEKVKAFVPFPLPPIPALKLTGRLAAMHERAVQNCLLLNLAGQMVPDLDWFLYGFVRKEAVISSQIEGTQATLMDLLEAEAVEKEQHSEDVEEVVNYVRALNFCVKQLRAKNGLPISLRLLKEAHRILLTGAKGEQKAPGEFRRSQNWVGGSRPGNARFVPPPADKLTDCLHRFEHYLYAKDSLPPIVRAGLAHVQFETIHPFLDGNGRVGRLLITLLLLELKILESPLLYLSLHFKRHRNEYYDRLSAVRSKGDWEGWISFYLEGVCGISAEGAKAARNLFEIVKNQRQKVLADKRGTVVAVRLMELIPRRPVVTMPLVVKELGVTKPTAQKAIDLLCTLKIISEISGRERGKKYAFSSYLKELGSDTEVI